MTDQEGQQVSIFAQGNADEQRRKRVTETLDALVEEAYQRAIDSGTAITNPDAWRAWKRRVYVDIAKQEGPGYLKGHYHRLIGGGRVPPVRHCDFCESILGIAWFEIGEKKFCDVECAEGRTKLVPLAEWRKKVKREGGYTNAAGEFVPLDQIKLIGTDDA